MGEIINIQVCNTAFHHHSRAHIFKIFQWETIPKRIKSNLFWHCKPSRIWPKPTIPNLTTPLYVPHKPAKPKDFPFVDYILNYSRLEFYTLFLHPCLLQYTIFQSTAQTPLTSWNPLDSCDVWLFNTHQKCIGVLLMCFIKF